MTSAQPRNSPAPSSLVARLSRRLIWIAFVILVANVAFVAYYDGADRDALLSDVASREIERLDAAVQAAPMTPPVIRDAVRTIYAEYPQAYGYAVIDPEGRIVDSMNEAIFPISRLYGPVMAKTWIARAASASNIETIASSIAIRPEGEYRTYFGLIDDPANLVAYEIWSEFLGHVWLPLIPTVILLIAGSLLVIRRDLAPVAAAAAWARALHPGRSYKPFEIADQPSEIADLTEAVNRAVGRLNSGLESERRRAAEAAHALRTPVAVLVARLDGLPQDPAFDALRDDVKELSRTVTQFLLVAGADRLELEDDAFADLNAVAETTVSKLSPYAALSNTELSFSPSEAPCVVQGVPDAIELALTNLIENAMLHGRGAPVEVNVGPGPVVCVRDSGPGLPGDTKEKMLEPFWRGEDAPRGGAGLGLAIVTRIQNAHGGTLEAVNLPDGGAQFKLTYRAVGAKT